MVFIDMRKNKGVFCGTTPIKTIHHTGQLRKAFPRRIDGRATLNLSYATAQDDDRMCDASSRDFCPLTTMMH